MVINKLILLTILIICCNVNATWVHSWTARTDIAGKPIGIFTNTPYPITESTVTYSITNDEGVKTYNVGTLIHVDGASADDTGTGLTLLSPKKYIQSGITVANSGNYTIIVRGAHDAFDGIYYLTNETIHPKAGTDDTHRIQSYFVQPANPPPGSFQYAIKSCLII